MFTRDWVQFKNETNEIWVRGLVWHIHPDNNGLRISSHSESDPHIISYGIDYEYLAQITPDTFIYYCEGYKYYNNELIHLKETTKFRLNNGQVEVINQNQQDYE